MIRLYSIVHTHLHMYMYTQAYIADLTILFMCTIKGLRKSFFLLFQGLFRISCEDILKILRRGRETLLTLLEAFVYDPLIDWTQSEEATFPLAIRTAVSSEQGARQTRKEMEWEVAEGMLITKLAESESHWHKNRLDK